MPNCCHSYNSLSPWSFRMNDGSWLLVWECATCGSMYKAEFNISTTAVIITDLQPISPSEMSRVVDKIDHGPIDKFQLKNLLSGIDIFELDHKNCLAQVRNPGILNCPNCIYKPSEIIEGDIINNPNRVKLICHYCNTEYTALRYEDAHTPTTYEIYGIISDNSVATVDEDVTSEEDSVVSDTEIEETVSDDISNDTLDTEEDEVVTLHKSIAGLDDDGIDDDSSIDVTSVVNTIVVPESVPISSIPVQASALIQQADEMFDTKMVNDTMDASSITSGVRVRIHVTSKHCDTMAFGECITGLYVSNTKKYELHVDSLDIDFLTDVSIEYDRSKPSKWIISDPNNGEIPCEQIVDVALHEDTVTNIVASRSKNILHLIRIHIRNSGNDLLPQKLKNGYLYIEFNPLINFGVEYVKRRN